MRRLLVLAVLVALAGAACGDDGGAAATTATTAESTTTTTAESTTTAEATTTTGPEDPLALEGQETLRGIRNLQSVPFPAHFEDYGTEPVRTGDEFDVSEYLTVLDHLAMEDGYTLDYVYSLDGMGGHPMLYARPVDQAGYGTRTEYEENHDQSDDFIDHVVVDDTAAGYLQFVLLDITAGQFYLWWHAGYNDTSPLLTRGSLAATLDAGIEMAADQMELARAVDPAPVVTLGPETAEVQIYTWTKWGGLSLRTFEITRSFPHEMVGRYSDRVAEYDCGWVF